MASSSAAVRKAIRGLEDGLHVFTAQLAQETAELKRNVDNQPCTGASFYRNILEDLAQRLEGLGQELQALEGVSVDAVSLEELVGHSVALYRQNHEQIQGLEAALARYGYRDLFAPLPPESPLDMLEMAGPGPGHAQQSQKELEEAYAGGDGAYGDLEAYGEQAPNAAGEALEEALGEVTNRLAAAYLMAVAPCDTSPAGRTGGGMGGGAPRTTLKALAPMTAAKALMRADTPSSLASPEALSPSMRELLGKYAASSNGGTQPHMPASTAGSTPFRSGGDGGHGGGATPPVPSYLSPAFQLAAMEQEVQMAHAEAAAQHSGGGGGTPGWQPDDEMYSALTATACKLAAQPSFMDAYRQRFPHIMASTERLLQTVEKQRRPAAAAAVAQEELAGGPMAALTEAAQQAAAGGQVQQAAVAGGQQRQLQQHNPEEESTMDLMSQVLGPGRRLPLAEEATEDISGAAAAASSTQFHAAAAPPPVPEPASSPPAAAQQERPPPSTAALLSRALPGVGTSGAAAAATASSELPYSSHPISRLLADEPQPEAAAAARPAPAASVLQSAPRSERSKPQLEAAIAAALGRSTSAAAPTPAAACAAPAAVPCSAAPAVVGQTPAAAAAPRPAPPTSVARPPPAPPAAPAAAGSAATGAAAAPVAVPQLRPVTADEYGSLPSFIKSQLPLDLLNATLEAVHTVAAERSSGFTMGDVEAAGLPANKCKVVVNSLVKLGRAQLKVTPSGTVYLLA